MSLEKAEITLYTSKYIYWIHLSQRLAYQWSNELSKAYLKCSTVCFFVSLSYVKSETLHKYWEKEKNVSLFSVLNWDQENLKLSLMIAKFLFNDSFKEYIIKPAESFGDEI